MNSYDAALAAAALEVGERMVDADGPSYLEEFGHDEKSFSEIAQTVVTGFTKSFFEVGDLSYLKPMQRKMVIALACTAWEMGAISAEVAYGSKP